MFPWFLICEVWFLFFFSIVPSPTMFYSLSSFSLFFSCPGPPLSSHHTPFPKNLIQNTGRIKFPLIRKALTAPFKAKQTTSYVVVVNPALIFSIPVDQLGSHWVKNASNTSFVVPLAYVEPGHSERTEVKSAKYLAWFEIFVSCAWVLNFNFSEAESSYVFILHGKIYSFWLSFGFYKELCTLYM